MHGRGATNPTAGTVIDYPQAVYRIIDNKYVIYVHMEKYQGRALNVGERIAI